MKTITNIIHPLFALFTFACFALLQTAQAVVPPPDGGYPRGNTAEGDNALLHLTTGSENTAIGFKALFSNTTGLSNTANGYQALFSNTDGFTNTANGAFALANNRIGDDNTAIGYAALYRNTTGFQNTANGSFALSSNTLGHDNTATGYIALYSNTTGSDNTANGFQALMSHTTGDANNAFGDQALSSNTIGSGNTAVGASALGSLTDGDSNTAIGNATLIQSGIVNFNTALGRRALFRSQGDQNIGLGFFAGSNLNDGGANNIFIGNVGPVPIGSESNTIRIGTQFPSVATVGNPPVERHLLPRHTATYIAGITGTGVMGTAVMINSNGKLGVASSSARFKQDIQSMDKASEAIHALKPVTFRYKKEVDADRTPQFGLVAEQVEKVNPDLVVRDADGKAYTVRYDAVNAMLLNEFLKEHRKVEEQSRKIQEQDATITEFKKEMQTIAARLKEQDSRIEKVSAQIEMGRPTPKVVVNRP
jgi:hypothetical protein